MELDATTLTVGVTQDYQVVRPLGRGANSCVYHVKSLHTQQDYALKIVDKAKLTPPLVHRLCTELEIQSSLDHPCIVKLFHYFQDDDAVYLLLELCEGGDLHRHVLQAPYSERDTKHLVGQLVEGLAYLHAQGVLHRDIKLGNLPLECTYHFLTNAKWVSANSLAMCEGSTANFLLDI